MPTYTLKKLSQTVGNGIGTWTSTVSDQGIYSVSAFITEIPPSGIIVTINKNGSPLDVTSTPAPSQAVINANTLIGCVPGDIITIVLSSPTTADLVYKMVKSIFNVHLGI